MKHVTELEFRPCALGMPITTEQRFALASEISDRRIQHGVWESGPGTIEIRFEWDETVYVLEGSAEVENQESGETTHLRAGSLMSFPRGSHWKWRVPIHLKKLFTLIDSNPE